MWLMGVQGRPVSSVTVRSRRWVRCGWGGICPGVLARPCSWAVFGLLALWGRGPRWVSVLIKWGRWDRGPVRERSPGPRAGPCLGPRFLVGVLVAGVVTFGEGLGDVVGADDFYSLGLGRLDVVCG